MKLERNLYQRLRLRYYQRKCYTSIEDLPVLVWFKIHEGGEFTLLYKKSGKANKYLSIIFDSIYDQFIKDIGLTKEYLSYLEQLKSLGIMRCDLCINSTPIKKVQLAIQEEKLNKITTTSGVSYNQIIAQVSKAQGYSVRNVSVIEFYSYLKLNNGK